MKKVLVTCKIPGPALNWLAERCDLEVYGDGRYTMPDQELRSRISEFDGVITLLSNQINEEVLALAPRLKVVSNYAVGYNNIDVTACTNHKVWACNTPGVLTETTADLAWTLLMAVSRRIVEADAYVRNGQFDGWFPDLMMGSDIHNKTLGVIGMGRIGQAVARRGLGFNMNVQYTDEMVSSSDIKGARKVSFADLLATSDYISIHVPYLPTTHHLIDAAAFAQMKPTAFIINTARGPIIDEAALVSALQDRKIAGAGLDVYEEEPTVHPALLAMKNVVLAPHIGSSSVATRQKMSELAVQNLWRVLEGQAPLHAVNKIE